MNRVGSFLISTYSFRIVYYRMRMLKKLLFGESGAYVGG